MPNNNIDIFPELKYLNKFNQLNIAVIGDLMLDKYIYGDVLRISPEAPIPIVTVKSEKYVPGGAANVATNIATLNGNAFLLGIVGEDYAKDILLKKAKDFSINTNGVIVDKTKKTILKERVIGQNQQLLRIDYEDTRYIGSYTNNLFLKNLEKLNDISVIIISDYAKGTVTMEMMTNIKKYAKEKEILIMVDPKPKHKSFYEDVFLITPNKKEAEEMANMTISNKESLEVCGKKLIKELNCNVIITMGDEGMAVFDKESSFFNIPTIAKEVFDVSGAGDTVVATLGLSLAAGASLSDSARISNSAAGIKVGKLGTAPVSIVELTAALNK